MDDPKRKYLEELSKEMLDREAAEERIKTIKARIAGLAVPVPTKKEVKPEAYAFYLPIPACPICRTTNIKPWHDHGAKGKGPQKCLNPDCAITFELIPVQLVDPDLKGRPGVISAEHYFILGNPKT